MLPCPGCHLWVQILDEMSLESCLPPGCEACHITCPEAGLGHIRGSSSPRNAFCINFLQQQQRQQQTLTTTAAAVARSQQCQVASSKTRVRHRQRRDRGKGAGSMCRECLPVWQCNFNFHSFSFSVSNFNSISNSNSLCASNFNWVLNSLSTKSSFVLLFFLFKLCFFFAATVFCKVF